MVDQPATVDVLLSTQSNLTNNVYESLYRIQKPSYRPVKRQ